MSAIIHPRRSRRRLYRGPILRGSKTSKSLVRGAREIRKMSHETPMGIDLW